MAEIPTTVKNKELIKKRREQIVRAGIKLFSQKGFHGTTLRELAEEAGLSYGNIYDYVGSKEDIFSLIHDFTADLVMAALRSSIEQITDPLEKLRRIVRAEFTLMDQWADAILLLYQESHILSKPHLRKLLGKEREHLDLIEAAIEEAKRSGRICRCNTRLTANLIKSMIDAWVIKRWDLRGHTDRLEGERAILALVFHGLLTGNSANGSAGVATKGGWESRAVFIANASTPLGSGICKAFAGKGDRLTVHSDPVKPTRENPLVCNNSTEGVKFFSTDQYGPISSQLFDRIEAETGPIDVYVHDLGAGNMDNSDEAWGDVGERLTINLKAAEEVAAHLEADLLRRLPQRIIYLAPWGWDQFVDPYRFETARAGAVALTKSLAHALANRGTTVNCLVPGYIRTTRPSTIEKGRREDIATKIPIGHIGQISDVIEPVAFMASDGAKYITGQVIGIGGGLELTVR
jgi:3-oxoacyl-[acyl-carrier protein] reductase